MNVEVEMYLENQHFSNIVIIDSGKNHPWMLKTIGWNFDKEQDIYKVSKNSTPQIMY